MAAALGLDPKRGDTIVVSSSAFDAGETPTETTDEGGLLAGKNLSTIVAAAMLVLITLLLARSARRPKVKALDIPEVLPALPGAGREKAALPAAAPAALPAGTVPNQRQEEAPVDLLQAVESQPDDVAHLLRGWLSESGPNSSAGAR